MTLSPRYLVVLNLLLLALAAYSASGIVGTAIATRLLAPPDVDISPMPPPIVAEKAKPATYYSIINQRDIFNSAKPVEAAPAAEPPKKTQLKVKLWGIAVHQGEDSYCIIEDQSARNGQKLFRIDDMVAGIAKVKAIEWDRVILNHDGVDEILELTPETSPPGVSAVASAFPGGTTPGLASVPGGGGANAGTVPPRAGAAPAVDDGNIQAVNENEYEISRGEVDKAFENLGQLFTQMRAVPHFEGGKTVGFRLFAIRSGSLFDKIGLRNGDVIKRINDVEMNDPGRAINMLQEFRNESNLTVALVRNRQDKTISYQIR